MALLEIENLVVEFQTSAGMFRAVDSRHQRLCQPAGVELSRVEEVPLIPPEARIHVRHEDLGEAALVQDRRRWSPSPYVTVEMIVPTR